MIILNILNVKQLNSQVREVLKFKEVDKGPGKMLFSVKKYRFFIFLNINICCGFSLEASPCKCKLWSLRSISQVPTRPSLKYSLFAVLLYTSISEWEGR